MFGYNERLTATVEVAVRHCFRSRVINIKKRQISPLQETLILGTIEMSAIDGFSVLQSETQVYH